MTVSGYAVSLSISSGKRKQDKTREKFRERVWLRLNSGGAVLTILWVCA